MEISKRDKLRDRMLSGLPKNAVVAEIGVWEGFFSGRIMEICQPATLHLIEHWKVTATVAFNLGGLLGTLLTIPLAKHLGRRPMFALYFGASAAAILATFGLDMPAETRLYMFFAIGADAREAFAAVVMEKLRSAPFINEQVFVTVVVVIAPDCAHRNAVLARVHPVHAKRSGNIFKGAVAQISVKCVSAAFAAVGHVNVLPSIAIKVRD